MADGAHARGRSGGVVEEVARQNHAGGSELLQCARARGSSSEHHKKSGARNSNSESEHGWRSLPHGGANAIGESERSSHPASIQSRILDVKPGVEDAGLDTSIALVEFARMASTPGAKVMKRLDALRQIALKGKPMPPADLAERAGLSRATWFNRLNGTYEVTVDEAFSFAHALKANFGVIIGEQEVVSGSPATVVHQQTIGDLVLSDSTAQLVAFMRELDENQQERVLKMVMNAISLAGGFLEPGADEGPAARKK